MHDCFRSVCACRVVLVNKNQWKKNEALRGGVGSSVGLEVCLMAENKLCMPIFSFSECSESNYPQDSAAQLVKIIAGKYCSHGSSNTCRQLGE